MLRVVLAAFARGAAATDPTAAAPATAPVALTNERRLNPFSFIEMSLVLAFFAIDADSPFHRSGHDRSRL